MVADLSTAVARVKGEIEGRRRALLVESDGMVKASCYTSTRSSHDLASRQDASPFS